MSTNTNTTYAATASASISGTSNVSMSVTPTSSGATITGSTRVNYSVSNAISYRLTLSSSTANTTLVSTNTSVSTESIPTTGSDAMLSNLAANTWGFCINTGTAACPANYTFRSVRSSSNAYTLASGTLSSSTSSSSSYATSGTRTLTYGAKIDNNLAAGTYSNTQIISLTAEDKPDTLEYVTYMQDMTSTICANTRTPTADETTTVPTTQLIDSRDGKNYWVAKLADGNCWMTQNLDLELSTSVTLTPSNTDITSNWTPDNSTTTNMRPGDGVTGMTIRSFDAGEYVIRYPNAGTNLCSSSVAVITSCSGFSGLYDISGWSDTFVSGLSGTIVQSIRGEFSIYDAHYTLGDYYNWFTATAGTGQRNTNTNASGSICPKGWKLPIGNSTSDGSYAYLASTYGFSSSSSDNAMLGSAPLYLHRSGIVAPQASNGIRHIGSRGYYYTRTAANNASYAYSFVITENSGYTASYSYYRPMSYSVRCMINV